MYCKACGKKTNIDRLGLCSECSYNGFSNEEEKDIYDYIESKKDKKPT